MKETGKLLKKRLISQIVIPAVFSVAILVTGYLITNPAVKRLLVAERQQMVQEMVNVIYQLLDQYNQKVVLGEISREKAQEIIIDNIKHQRYGKNHTNYFWIQDYKGNFIYHPYIDATEAMNPQTTESMHEIALKVAEMVKKQKNGFISYEWFTPQTSSQKSLKESYAQGFEEWNWILGTGFIVADIDDDLKKLTGKVMSVLFFFLGGLLIILTVVLFRNYLNLQKLLVRDIELKRSEARFRGFVEHIDNGLMIFENGKPVFVNNQFNKIFSIHEKNLSEFNLENYLPKSEKERVKVILNTSSGNDTMELSTWLKVSDETEKFVNLKYISDTHAEITYKYLVVQDQTQQKQTLTTIEILSENLTQSPEAIVITDLNGNIEYVNPGFEKITGYSFEEVKGKKTNLLKSGKMSPMVYEDLWKTISGGEIWSGELLNQKKDDTLFWESTIIFPIKNRQGEIIKYSSIKTDISHNKRIEQELLAAKDKAEENERIKTAFLNNVSHEVRTPLNAIYGFSQIIKKSLPKEGNLQEYLMLMEQNCLILMRLFEDILDYSSIESRSVRLEKEDIPVKDLLMKIVSKHNVQLTVDGTKPIEIIVNQDNNFETMVLFTDRKRFTQVFDKLLSNAVKFTEEGHIQISYDIEPGNITFHISDTGVGIPEHEKELIFETFSHGEKLFVSLHKGVGLGLNISKILVEMLGGKLSFSSEEGKGSTFSISFPSTELKNYTIDGKPVADYNHSLSDKNILIAEDNDENFQYIETILSRHNHVIRARTGSEAVTMFNEGSVVPDIILMDLLMPEMDGISATRMIRKKSNPPPIIAITAIGSALSKPESNLFDAILSKPVSAKVLINTIKRLI